MKLSFDFIGLIALVGWLCYRCIYWKWISMKLLAKQPLLWIIHQQRVQFMCGDITTVARLVERGESANWGFQNSSLLSSLGAQLVLIPVGWTLRVVMSTPLLWPQMGHFSLGVCPSTNPFLHNMLCIKCLFAYVVWAFSIVVAKLLTFLLWSWQ